MSRIFNLYRLQQVDSQLDKSSLRLAEIGEILGDDDALQAALIQGEEVKLMRIEAENELRFVEEEVRAHQIKIEQNQSRLYSGKVTNPKELQDLQAEAEAFKRQLSSLEDSQIEKMLALEDRQSEESNAGKALHIVQVDRKNEHGDLAKEQTVLLEEKNQIENEREAVIKIIEDEDLRFYNQTRKSKNGLAVVKITDKTCSACGNQLSQALAQAARSPDEINRCSTCKRILYAG